MKICSKCKEEKELSEFHKDKHGKCGVKSKCKECMKNYRSQGNYKNLERLRTVKNKDRNTFLIKERRNKHKQQYIIKKNVYSK
jgi:hypothetical protein